MNKFEVVETYQPLVEGGKAYKVFYVYDILNDIFVTLDRSPADLPFLTRTEAVRVLKHLKSVWA